VEHAVLEIMQMSNLAAIHVNRVTLMQKDMQFIRRVLGAVHDPNIWFPTKIIRICVNIELRL
jgi:Core histone H2A/H2B/H3/H4